MVRGMFKDRNYNVIVLAVLAALTAACDKAQLLAPTQSTITVSAPTRVLASNGTTPITAAVMEQAGTPVQNGTTVRFTTTLGRVDPVEVQTVNGLAITTFFAGGNSGKATISATSGAATGGEGKTNSVEITIGAAAVNTVTLRASPGTVGPNGGTVQLIATVVDENGQAVEGVLVTFNADQGSLGSTTAITNSSGEARTTLTTSQQAVVSATAGTKTSSNVTVGARAGPIVSITCATVPSGGTCSGVVPTSNNTATVAFTVTRPATGSSVLRSATLDFGDGTSQALGNLAGGSVTVTHTYNGSDTSNPRPYTATVLATDINGESTSASVTVLVLPRTTTAIAVNLTAAEASKTQLTARWTFTADATGGGEGGTGNANITSYSWDFGDGETATTTGNRTSHVYDRNSAADPQTERRTVSVTARTADGRSGKAQEDIIVQYNASPP